MFHSPGPIAISFTVPAELPFVGGLHLAIRWYGVLIASANPWSFALAVERQMAREHSADTVDVLDLWSVCGRFSPHWSRRSRGARPLWLSARPRLRWAIEPAIE